MKKYIVLAAAGLVLPLGAVASQVSKNHVGFSQEQVAAGGATYASRCAVCHNENLEGGDLAPSLKGEQFWHLWGAQPIHQLYSRIISTMPLDEPGVLTEEEAMNVVAYIANANGAVSSDKAVVSHASSLVDAFFMGNTASPAGAPENTESDH